MVEMREKRAEREAAKEAREAAKAAAEADGGPAEADGTEPGKAPAKKGGRRRPKKPAPTTARTKRARSKT